MDDDHEDHRGAPGTTARLAPSNPTTRRAEHADPPASTSLSPDVLEWVQVSTPSGRSNVANVQQIRSHVTRRRHQRVASERTKYGTLRQTNSNRRILPLALAGDESKVSINEKKGAEKKDPEEDLPLKSCGAGKADVENIDPRSHSKNWTKKEIEHQELVSAPTTGFGSRGSQAIWLLPSNLQAPPYAAHLINHLPVHALDAGHVQPGGVSHDPVYGGDAHRPAAKPRILPAVGQAQGASPRGRQPASPQPGHRLVRRDHRGGPVASGPGAPVRGSPSLATTHGWPGTNRQAPRIDTNVSCVLDSLPRFPPPENTIPVFDLPVRSVSLEPLRRRGVRNDLLTTMLVYQDLTVQIAAAGGLCRFLESNWLTPAFLGVSSLGGRQKMNAVFRRLLRRPATEYDVDLWHPNLTETCRLAVLIHFCAMYEEYQRWPPIHNPQNAASLKDAVLKAELLHLDDLEEFRIWVLFTGANACVESSLQQDWFDQQVHIIQKLYLWDEIEPILKKWFWTGDDCRRRYFAVWQRVGLNACVDI
ncbi:hypothetical protein BP6252_11262 [Coleophoma cylindrospora]|uniref:Uncharacterized protein n=1 Tax=Coleophoma cylindrospora TaxID=1849047 RepID=A0A3D8QPK3_9HELO|nr:hypothetical protein BP6252_11262 [Coleophoma cylindrospora]